MTDVNLSEDLPKDDTMEWITVYVPGMSTRVAVVNIDCNEETERNFPGTNVGWAALGENQYLSFATIVPEGPSNLAVVVYSDDWETQQAFALGYDGQTGGLVLIPIVLDAV